MLTFLSQQVTRSPAGQAAQIVQPPGSSSHTLQCLELQQLWVPDSLWSLLHLRAGGTADQVRHKRA
jgi:hypothetical protein